MLAKTERRYPGSTQDLGNQVEERVAALMFELFPYDHARQLFILCNRLENVLLKADQTNQKKSPCGLYPHTRRVRTGVDIVAEKMGYGPQSRIRWFLAGTAHDIGKIPEYKEHFSGEVWDQAKRKYESRAHCVRSVRDFQLEIKRLPGHSLKLALEAVEMVRKHHFAAEQFQKHAALAEETLLLQAVDYMVGVLEPRYSEKLTLFQAMEKWDKEFFIDTKGKFKAFNSTFVVQLREFIRACLDHPFFFSGCYDSVQPQPAQSSAREDTPPFPARMAAAMA